ncbi:hypothetical protein C6A37_05870 [Desulfobacteraceae bacterium SEEP-SAG9]|nr:hypothetical protein C6A37_05870 [Desulfobacteraceae bacterium SEEP-SAG9]
MNVTEKRNLLKSQLNENLALLEKAFNALAYSNDKCRIIGEKSDYDMEEQESFEALTSRFARTADILTQKVFKTVFALLQENVKTIIDAGKFAEKLGIVDHADTILNIRELRNQIAHEYVNSDLNMLFMDVLRYVPVMEKVIEGVRTYVRKELN